MEDRALDYGTTDDNDLLDPMEVELNRMFQRDQGAADQHPVRASTDSARTSAAGGNRRCTGDPVTCHTIFWPVVPEEAKAWWRAILQSRRTGRTLSQALRAAEAAQADARLRANAMAKLADSASVASHK